MPQLLQARNAPVHLVLGKDRIKTLKSGHPWVYAESLQTLPKAPAGSLALVKTKDGDIIAKVCDAPVPVCRRKAAGHLVSTALIFRFAGGFFIAPWMVSSYRFDHMSAFHGYSRTTRASPKAVSGRGIYE